MKLNSYSYIEELTKKLVAIRSVNLNENNIADFIYDYFYNFDYFKKNPNQLIKVKTQSDAVDRHSIVAYIKGKTDKTIILLGHIDTVDTKDYGPVEEYANNVDELPLKLKEFFNLDQEVIDDINSNKYMFGRGSLDMKSGVASNIYIMEYFINHPEELNGNLLFIAEADEEGESLGILSCLDEINKIAEKENFKYIAAINTDFHTPIGGKDHKAIHVGTIGKLLPCFAVFGKEAHVGKSFDSFDPNLLLSMINTKISYNVDLCDNDKTNTTVPPVCLKQMDNKDSYTVQTALSAFGYFNYLIYNSSPRDVMNKCKSLAIEAFDEVNELINSQYKKYCEINKYDYQKLSYETNVYTYAEWFKHLEKDNSNFKNEMDAYAKELNQENPKEDLRIFGYKMIQKSYEYYKERKPVVVIFFGTMYYSPIECKDNKLLDSINQAITNIDYKEEIKTELFYPYISDMSFLGINSNNEIIEEMLSNCPQHGYKYIYPYQKIRNINVPVINIGTYGKDGHKFTERVDKEYTFNCVPNLTYETIIDLLK